MLDRRRGAHLPGPDHQYSNAELTQCLSEPEVEAVEAGLGGSVYEVGPSHPLAGSGTHCDDLAEALRAHLLAEQHTDRNGCGVVDLAICTALRWFCHSSSALPSRPKATIATSTSL